MTILLNPELIILKHEQSYTLAMNLESDFILRFKGIEEEVFHLLETHQDILKIMSVLEEKYTFQGKPLREFLESFFRTLEEKNFVRIK
jgi:hypothetical protein